MNDCPDFYGHAVIQIKTINFLLSFILFCTGTESFSKKTEIAVILGFVALGVLVIAALIFAIVLRKSAASKEGKQLNCNSLFGKDRFYLGNISNNIFFKTTD